MNKIIIDLALVVSSIGFGCATTTPTIANPATPVSVAVPQDASSIPPCSVTPTSANRGTILVTVNAVDGIEFGPVSGDDVRNHQTYRNIGHVENHGYVYVHVADANGHWYCNANSSDDGFSTDHCYKVCQEAPSK